MSQSFKYVAMNLTFSVIFAKSKALKFFFHIIIAKQKLTFTEPDFALGALHVFIQFSPLS